MATIGDLARQMAGAGATNPYQEKFYPQQDLSKQIAAAAAVNSAQDARNEEATRQQVRSNLGMDTNPAAAQAQAQANAQAAAQAAAQQAAAEAEAKRLANLRMQVSASQTNLRDSAESGVGSLVSGYGTQNRDFYQSVQDQQEGINKERTNTALSRLQSIQSIINQTRQGVQSGMITLSGYNAGDSGAADALARAYSTLGSQQVGSVQNQAALKNADTDVKQQKLQRTVSNKRDDFQTYRKTQLDSIGTNLANQLRSLDVNAQAQGLSGAVNQGIKNALINDAIAKLNAIDSDTVRHLQEVNKATDSSQAAAEAQRLSTLGMTPVDNPFTVANLPGVSTTATPLDTAVYTSTGLPLVRRPDEVI